MADRFSIIIPAYNEKQRLPRYLNSIRAHLSQNWGDNYEIIIVDDGSDDDLREIVRRLSKHWPQLFLLRHAQKRGKGAAVRMGMLAATGEILLFADADGATPIEEERKLRARIERGADVAIGSRLVSGPGLSSNRIWHRAVCGRLFAVLARLFLALPIQDTQCGFKMFRRTAGLRLFQLCREPGYLFDLEVLAWSQRLGYQIAEVPVRWTDIPGSKVRLLSDGGTMLRGLWRLGMSLRMRGEQACQFGEVTEYKLAGTEAEPAGMITTQE